jgi:quercetin dioxygenase-like cupin family protein
MHEATVLHLSPSERVVVVSADPERLVLEVVYDAGGTPPPRHLHPAQGEDFEVLAGRLTVEIEHHVTTRDDGATFAVPAGVVHRMWNASDAACTARWTVTPAGRTLDMFREIDALHRGGREPSRLAMGRVVARYGDGFRLAGPAGWLLALGSR